MQDTRKYFDYELAYEMFIKVRELFNKGGFKELEKHFEPTGDKGNGYIAFYGEEYNTWVYLSNKKFDNTTDYIEDTNDEDWYVSGEVDIISYGEGEDNLFIDNIECIKERMCLLVEYAMNNNYTFNDVKEEYKSLKKVEDILKKRIY